MAKSKKQPKKQAEKTLWTKILENKTRLAVIILVLIAVPVAIITNDPSSDNEPQAQAQEQQEQQDQEQAPPAENEESDASNDETAAATHEYVAQAGDTFSQVARKAIQTYGINNNVNLSQAQIIYAETLLTQEAGSPLLNEGQKVSIKESTVKSWVDKAQQLSDEAKKAWEAYTVGVDFNTDNVGESS